MAEKKDIDEVSGVETTGHEWDGIKELNNPMPRWWLWTFYACVIWGLGYTVFYPAWPMITTATSGTLGWSSRADLRDELSAAEAAKGERVAAIRQAPVEDVLADPSLRSLAISAGQAAFKVNCVQCHGAGAAGGAGYPNLNDDDWIWGGTPQEILLTLQHGIRYEQDPDTRISDMPAFGADEILTRAEIADVAWHVRALAGLDHEADAAERGAELYVDNCAACHGDAGEGVRELGGPRLADTIWLYGDSHGEIVAQINRPQMGVMPGWQPRLDEMTLKSLTAYVHSLGGGE